MNNGGVMITPPVIMCPFFKKTACVSPVGLVGEMLPEVVLRGGRELELLQVVGEALHRPECCYSSTSTTFRPFPFFQMAVLFLCPVPVPCNCALYLCTVCTSVLYQRTVPVSYTCVIFLLHVPAPCPVPVPCTCALYLCPVPVYFT